MKGVLQTSPQTESQRRFDGRRTAHHEAQRRRSPSACRSLERPGCSNACACGHSPRNGSLQIVAHAEAKIAAHKNDKLHCRRNLREAGSAKQTQIRGMGWKELTLKTKRNHGPCLPADDQQHHSKFDRSRTSDCPEDRYMWQQAWQKGYEKMDTRG